MSHLRPSPLFAEARNGRRRAVEALQAVYREQLQLNGDPLESVVHRFSDETAFWAIAVAEEILTGRSNDQNGLMYRLEDRFGDHYNRLAAARALGEFAVAVRQPDQFILLTAHLDKEERRLIYQLVGA